MTVFLILAAVLVASALLLVIPPMLGFGARRREHRERQKQAETALVVLREQLAELEADREAGLISERNYKRATAELEQRALEEGRAAEESVDLRPARGWAAGLALVVPISAVAVYLMIGEPQGVEPERAAAAAEEEHITPERMAELTERLVERLEQDPSDETGWVMLARSYVMMGDAEGARRAWERIGDDVPDNPQILADWGDVLVAAQGGDFSGEPQRLIDRAIELEPDNFKARALAGASAFEREEFSVAAEHWERLLAQVPPSNEAYPSVLASVNQARQQAGQTPLLADGSALEDNAAADAVQLRGRVTVDDSLVSELDENATVFVFVSAPDGGVPFAAIQLPVSDLPADFDFSAAPRMNDAPLPDEVVVSARVSSQGDAQARPGDLEGAVGPVDADAENVSIVIDQVRE